MDAVDVRPRRPRAKIEITRFSQEPSVASQREMHALDADELQDLYPAALILEDVATRRAAPLDAVELAALREVNARLRATADDPEAAAAAHGEFHERLVGGDGDTRLHAVLRTVRRQLEPYERAALACAARVRRRAAHHEGIVSALERGDRRAAAHRVRAHWVAARDEIAAEIEGGPV
jgi:DNA-binding GntR family transcriptional regulator